MADKKDILITKLSYRIVFLSSVIIVLLIILIVVYFSKNEQGKCGVKDPPALCGNAMDETNRSDKYKTLNTSDLYYESSEKLFKQNCAVCHSLGKNMITGPGLQGIMSRVPSEKWLIAYISNCDSVYRSGDAYATKLHHDFHGIDMTNFSNVLNIEQIKGIVAYMKSY
ncbi:MAG: c-type cytochrome [Bacteroidia bacterium]